LKVAGRRQAPDEGGAADGIVGVALVLAGISTYAAWSWILARHTNTVLGDYFDITKLAPKLANITVKLP